MQQTETYYDLCAEIDHEFNPFANGYANLAEAKQALASYRRACPGENAFIIPIDWTRVSKRNGATRKKIV